MSTFRNLQKRTEAVTLSVRHCSPRSGTTHSYVPNGSLLRDVLVEGKWVTIHASDPANSRTA